MSRGGSGWDDDSIAFTEGNDLPSNIDVQPASQNHSNVALFAWLWDDITVEELNQANLP